MTPSSTDLADTIRKRLEDLQPSVLNIHDDSAQHAGHRGKPSGASHFTIQIVSSVFVDLPLVARHRLVYDRLQDLIPTPIHALSLDTQIPKEGVT